MQPPTLFDDEFQIPTQLEHDIVEIETKVSQSESDQIDQLAESMNVTRSEVLEKCLEWCVQEMQESVPHSFFDQQDCQEKVKLCGVLTEIRECLEPICLEAIAGLDPLEEQALLLKTQATLDRVLNLFAQISPSRP